MSTPWISLDRNLSPVQASVKMKNALEAQGRAIVNLGQGAETEKPFGGLATLLTFTAASHPLYNPDMGGNAGVRKAADSWVARFLGIRGKAFVTQSNGREGLNLAMQIAAHQAIEDGQKPVILVPDTSWPMVESMAAKNHIKVVPYKMSKDGFERSIHRAIETHYSTEPDQPIVAIYTNGRHNPTGMQMSAEEMKRLMDYLGQRAERDIAPIMHIADHPYFHACTQRRGTCHLDNGYQDVLVANSKTPWVSLVSFSKALGTARPGLSIIVMRSDLEDKFRSYLSESVGVSYSPEFFQNVEQILAPEYDNAVLQHFAMLQAKYRRNRDSVLKLISGSLPLMEGDPNMTCLLEVPKELLGQTVQCSDGETRTINNVNDLVEYVGNEAGVIIVNNSTKDHAFVRLALAEADSQKFEGGLLAMSAALHKLEGSPRHAPQTAPDTGAKPAADQA